MIVGVRWVGVRSVLQSAGAALIGNRVRRFDRAGDRSVVLPLGPPAETADRTWSGGLKGRRNTGDRLSASARARIYGWYWGGLNPAGH
jgi:hypothetical protein